MFNIIIKTYDFLEKFTLNELKQFTKENILKIDETTFEVEFKLKENLNFFIENIIYYSRTITQVYLKLPCSIEIDFDKFKKEEIKFSGKKQEVIDLIGFDLLNREYKLNGSEKSTNVCLLNFLLYKLRIDSEKKFSIIDPQAYFGDLIIESSLFNPRQALNLKRRFDINFVKIFDIDFKLPKKEENKNKIIAFVQDDVDFKKLKENIEFVNQKIQLSKFDLDMLDVKFKKAQIDFCVSEFDFFDEEKEFEEFCDYFLYQVEFMTKKKIGIISQNKLPIKPIEKYKLKIDFEKEIILSDEEGGVFYVYILSHLE